MAGLGNLLGILEIKEMRGRPRQAEAREMLEKLRDQASFKLRGDKIAKRTGLRSAAGEVRTPLCIHTQRALLILDTYAFCLSPVVHRRIVYYKSQKVGSVTCYNAAVASSREGTSGR